ncbi:peptidylprolyl isomerase [Adlercreutzia sp. ZJ304]|uniref:peptidylprolyl isomerase n=1 Tax=Adlercreutzia sp. ZJ304 TaxID=2709791 RepID=UPI0013EB55E6|nr:peptidylprolyl isomerase [Adlercreutzia sp. ZJ304]
MKNVRKIAVIAIAGCLSLTVLAGLAGCSGGSSSSSSASASSSAAAQSQNAPAATAQFSEDELLSGKHHAVIQVEGYDPITVEMDADAAPITVTNFVNLANNSYYNGKTFYRIVEDFCLQGGTLGNSASGNDSSLDTITGEFSSNGVENPLADNFDRGTIAMARTTLPNSATSTFFITLGNSSQVGASLDGQYAAFGTIGEEGMAIVDAIVADYIANVDNSQMGVISDETKQPIIESITVTD